MTTAPRERLAEAVGHHQAGRWSEAERLYRQILATHPAHADALHLLGLLAYQAGQASAAVPLIRRSIAVRPEFPAAHLNLGAALLETGDVAGAIDAFEAARRLNPAQPESHSNLGNALRLAGRHEEAEAACRRAIEIDPQYANAYNHRGLALAALGRIDEATEAYRAAIARQPRHLEAHRNLGAALHESGRPSEALEVLRRALEIRPGDLRSLTLTAGVLRALGELGEAESTLRRAVELPGAPAEVWAELGHLLHSQARFAESIPYLERAVELRPDFAEALFNLATACVDVGRSGDAERFCRRAVELQPDSPHGLVNLGVLLHRLHRDEEAVASYRRAIELQSDLAEAWNGLGAALFELGELQEGLEACERALRHSPGLAAAHFNRGVFRLLQGDYVAGWQDYEYRLHQPKWRRTAARFTRPRWNGEPLDGRRLLLIAEQGQGDIFQFVRYAAEIRAAGGRVIFAAPRRMIGVLSSCPGIEAFVALDDPWPEHDLCCEMMSVVRFFSPSIDRIPRSIPYLTARPDLVEYWRRELAGETGFRIAIAWQGSGGPGDYRRIPVAQFAPLAALPGVRLISVQTDGAAELAAARDLVPALDLSARIDQEHGAFQDTAAVLMNVDLMISSDTSTPHLAGALGRPVWMGLRQASEWRWMVDRSDTLWYPTMRLFRQSRPGDWEGVMRRMADELRRTLGA